MLFRQLRLAQCSVVISDQLADQVDQIGQLNQLRHQGGEWGRGTMGLSRAKRYGFIGQKDAMHGRRVVTLNQRITMLDQKEMMVGRMVTRQLALEMNCIPPHGPSDSRPGPSALNYRSAHQAVQQNASLA
ncbi:hypothetical protein YC2023_060735 [Brassica napus]